MPKVPIKGVIIYHEIHGKGFPLILAHGLGGNTGEWRYQTPELSKGYRLILWDQRGHGQSDSPPQRELYGRDTSAEDLLFLMDHLQIPMAYVGGTSLGGGVAAAFTVAHQSGWPHSWSSILLEQAGFPSLKNPAPCGKRPSNWRKPRAWRRWRTTSWRPILI